MKYPHKHLLIAACLAVAGLSAGAQTPPPPAGPGAMMQPGHPGTMRGMMQEHMQQRRAQRLAALKQILQITPAQEGAWSAWATSMQPSNRQRPNRAELAQLTTPERIDRMRALRSERIAAMDRRGDATKTFYAALTPAQQKSFDALAAQRMDRGMGGGHGGWGRHHG
ncbi:MAG TPA: Spy/CpxP family protein refolding chaperone [Ramlibacter sp.]|nr:Spy/CpxP family protein refolding chaperone [Ramlibacter sp.]